MCDCKHDSIEIKDDGMVKSGMIKSHKQAWRTLEKWSSKGWYEWGGTMDLGWKNADM